ncbi:MAG: oxamate carbamoyltransferase subunit AllH family protein [Janibacter sp.]
MPTVTRPDVAATASRWVRDLLAGWTGEATVLHSGPDAVYLHVGRDVMAVLSRHAVQVPCGLRTTLATTGRLTQDLSPPAPGSLVRIERQRLHFPGADVHVGRTVSHSAPMIDTTEAPVMTARLAGSLDPAVSRVRAELPDHLLQALATGDRSAVAGLLGRGSGLTPLGDDVLCGWLATMVAASHPCAGPVAEEILALSDQRTTALSATLLRRAARAEVVPEFTHLVRTLAHGSGPPGRAVQDLSRLGHTSGLGLVLGLSLALDHLASRSSCS